jgi:DNA end-binding protein Ku
MVAIAGAIIRQRTGEFDPSTYRDRYQEGLRGLIEAKLKGIAIKPGGDHAAPGDRSDGNSKTQSRTENACSGRSEGPKKSEPGRQPIGASGHCFR